MPSVAKLKAPNGKLEGKANVRVAAEFAVEIAISQS